MRSVIAALALWAAAGGAGAQTLDRMAPAERYLMDPSQETALALSAAPEQVALGAGVLPLQRDGSHRQARASANGFTCLVERSWSSPYDPARPPGDFWDPAVLAPICLNAEASATVPNEYLRRTELAFAGRNRAEIKRAIEADLASGRLRAPRSLALAYMLSPHQHLGAAVGHYRPHVMVYAPYASAADLGHNSFQSGDPIMLEHEGGVYATVVAPVGVFDSQAH